MRPAPPLRAAALAPAPMERPSWPLAPCAAACGPAGRPGAEGAARGGPAGASSRTRGLCCQARAPRAPSGGAAVAPAAGAAATAGLAASLCAGRRPGPRRGGGPRHARGGERRAGAAPRAEEAPKEEGAEGTGARRARRTRRSRGPREDAEDAAPGAESSEGAEDAEAQDASEPATFAVSPQNGNPHRCTLIYLHGWTGTAEDYLCRDSHTSDMSLPWRLGDTYAPGLRVLLPAAPTVPQPWGEELPSWYGYACQESNRVGDVSTLQAARESLGQFVRSELELLGGDSRRLFLGGMSQGCTAALDVYLREAVPLQLGGFVGSVGFVPSDATGFPGADEALEGLMADAEQARRPLWLNCAVEDEVEVPWSLVHSSLSPLRGRLPGLMVQKLRGVGHEIGDWEAFILNNFLENHAFDAYGDDMHEVVMEDFEEEDYWQWDWALDDEIEIQLDVGPDIPGMYG